MKAFDAIIIGTGQSGPPWRTAWRAQECALALSSAIGGTCVNTGCTPTKTLVASAYAAHTARRAGDYGVRIEGAISIDMKKVKERKDYLLGFSTRGVERGLRSNPHITVYQGHACFTGARDVRVGNEALMAPRIFINVGGRALVPEIPGLKDVPYLTNSSLLDIDFLPPHLLVVGGSYVGLEFVQVFRRFGSKVTIIEMAPRLIAREDGRRGDPLSPRPNVRQGSLHRYATGRAHPPDRVGAVADHAWRPQAPRVMR